MSFSEITHESWFSRIAGAFKGILVGGVLVLIAFPLLFWNEGRAVHRARTLAEGRDSVVENVPTDSVNPENEGKLVHMSGTAESNQTLTDEKFAITMDQAIKLSRQVEMFQWKEERHTRSKKKLGGGRKRVTTYEYEKVWSSKAIDSGEFNEKGRSTYGSGNPQMPFASAEFVADEVTFGAFKLAKEQVEKLNNYQSVPLEDRQTFAFVDPSQSEKLSVHNNYYYLGDDPANPKIGDVRIRFSSIGPSEISFIYQQHGDSFQPYQAKEGTLHLIENGLKSADELFTHAEMANTMLLWLLRLAGFAVMALGFGLMLRPFAVLSDVVPLLGGLVGFGVAIVAMLAAGGLSMVTIAIAWLFYRPVLGVALLFVAGVLFFLTRQFMNARKTVIHVDQPVVLG